MISTTVFVLLFLGVYSENNTIIKTPLGRIQGIIEVSTKGRQFHSFRGVPYAKPPVGNLRFEKPQPLEKWHDIWIADTYYTCIRDEYFEHTDTLPSRVQGEEDCLYLNIYTPNVDPNANLDVLVFFHGGGFQFGFAVKTGHNLMDRNVILIEVTYRLGILGFLSTEDDEIPGNNGLKDQTAALNWVKNNIKYFGGNPNSVTLFGLSAGGASVHLHYMMPQSKGLFHRGFSQSGVATNPWVLMEAPLKKARILGKSLGCDMRNTRLLKKCLKLKPARQIVEKLKQFQTWHYNPFSPFAVVVDGKWSKNPVLPRHPLELIQNKEILDLPWISSHTSGEGVFPCFDYYNDADISDLNSGWNNILPKILHYDYTIEYGRQNNVSQSIKSKYLQQNPLSMDNFNNFINICSDRLFLVDIGKTNHQHSQATTSPVYTYSFNYVEDRVAYSKFGASHGDDTYLILKKSIITNNWEPLEETLELREILLDMIEAYMKNGIPTMPVEWNPLSKNPDDDILELQINGPKNISMISKTALANYTYWDSLSFKENENLS